MYNHNKAQQSKNRVHISWDMLCLELFRSVSIDLKMAAYDSCVIWLLGNMPCDDKIEMNWILFDLDVNKSI